MDEKNAWLYNLYVPIEFYILLIMAQHLLKHRLSAVFIALVGLLYAVILIREIGQSDGSTLLYTRSTLLAFGSVTLLYAALLVDLAERTKTVLWKDQRFWVYLSVFLFMGPAIPYVGMMNEVYHRDPDLAFNLFLILDLLFLLRYGAAIVAGLLLNKARVQ